MDDFINAKLHELKQIRMLRQQKREEDDELAEKEDMILTEMLIHWEEKDGGRMIP